MKKIHTSYWFNVIRKAITRENKGLEPFSLEHRRKARGWVTCACGKQDPRIPRNTRRAPRDDLLFELGYEFSGAVRDAQPQQALATLLEIELRSAEIIAEFKKTKKENQT